MIIPKVLSGKPINGTQTISMRGRITEPFVLFCCQFPARGARPVRASALLGKPTVAHAVNKRRVNLKWEMFRPAALSSKLREASP